MNLRRLRNNSIIRNLIAETHIDKNQLIYPLFVNQHLNEKIEVPSMPGIYTHTMESIKQEISECLLLGLRSFLLFGVGEDKDEVGTMAYSEHSVIPKVLQHLKATFGNDILLITDVCLCAYTSHGHCGVIKNKTIDNASSLPLLTSMAQCHAAYGADMIAPSDMMDGRIAAIRQDLDGSGFSHIPIMSYAAKYASAYYGPFRDAAHSSPQFGDRNTYQMDIRNVKEAMLECEIDDAEGADIIMIKPALAYLDIVNKVSNITNKPIACYNVSGEYSMLKAAADKGWINEDAMILENLTSMKRAGAQIIISYHAKEILHKKLI